mmetsp:Transcript_42116/g.108412  ORF Transcript_42116/g.108412 Transcript_42116/m.108412 type:complete len:90 (+) Transcript_42116:766-1035(+)
MPREIVRTLQRHRRQVVSACTVLALLRYDCAISVRFCVCHLYDVQSGMRGVKDSICGQVQAGWGFLSILNKRSDGRAMYRRKVESQNVM